MNLKPEHRQRLLAIVAGAAIGLFALDSLVVKPYLEAWRDRRDRIESLDQQLVRGRALLERADALEQRWESMQRQALPADRSVAEDTVLRAAARWARESRVNFTSLTPQWRQPEPGYELLECRAGITGSLGEIARFLFELERDTVAVRVDELQLSSEDDRGRQLSANLRFSGLRFATAATPSTP